MNDNAPETGYFNLELEAAKLQMSPTLSKAALFSQDFPADLTDPQQRKEALTTMALDAIRAYDAGEIVAEKVEARAAFMGLVTIALMIANGGEPLKGEWQTAN